jgi:hypothetical protein
VADAVIAVASVHEHLLRLALPVGRCASRGLDDSHAPPRDSRSARDDAYTAVTFPIDAFGFEAKERMSTSAAPSFTST